MRKRASRSKRKTLVVILLISMTVAIACLGILFATSHRPTQHTHPTSNTPHSKIVPTPPSKPKPSSPAQLREKVAQLLMVGVTSKQMAIDLEKSYHIGGFLLRPGSGLFNKTALAAVESYSKTPLLLAIDQEGGYVSRIPNTTFSRDSALYMGTLSNDKVEALGYQMGAALSATGANIDLAPVVDLDDGHNAAVSAIDRSFSSDPAIVEIKSQAFSSGLLRAHVVPTYKHFPGLGYANGPSDGNTDSGPATSPPLAILKARDLLPYRPVFTTTSPAIIMVGNQIVPGLTGRQPASLSRATYQLLRTTYHFNQVIMTDELLLAKAVSTVQPDPSAAVITALKAGADIPLINPSETGTVGNIIDAVVHTIQDGRLHETDIDASLARVNQLRASL